MGSQTHNLGRGSRPIFIASPASLPAMIERAAQKNADLRSDAIYVRPRGGGLHVVKNVCNPTEFVVGSAIGDVTFTPGQSVWLGSHRGEPGEVIIGFPPPGQSGSSEVTVNLSLRSLRLNVQAAAPACPLPITGRTYLAIDRGDGALRAWVYHDGEYFSEIGDPLEIPAEWLMGFFPFYQRAAGDVVVFKTEDTATGGEALVTWTPAEDAFEVLDLEPLLADPPVSFDTVISGPVVVGSFIYFAHVDRFDTPTLWLYKVPLGASGAVDPESTRIGGGLVVPEEFFLTSGLIHTGGETFQLVATTFDGTVVPYFSGGWSSGTGRVPLDGGSDAFKFNGYNVLGNKSLRVAQRGPELFGPGLELLPAGPGSPGINLFPEAWDLSGELVISPNKQELALFPYFLSEEDAVIVRLKVQATPYDGTCPLPFIEVEPAPPTGRRPDALLCRD